MRILPLLIIFVALFAFGINTASADPSQIYVSPTGNDSWDGEFPVWQNTTYGPKLTIKNATGTVTTDGTVYVASGTYNESGIPINKNVNIIGENKDTTIINGTNSGAIMSVGLNRYLSLTNITFTNGNSTTGGGAIAISSGHVTIDNCIFQNNIAGLTGGAIHSQGTGSDPASLTITNSVFSNNKANGAGWGGAIFIALSSLTVTGSDFVNNIGTTGSAIHSNYGTINGINFNRIIGTGNSLIYSDVGGDATLNWWGSNADPITRVSGVTVDPWLFLTAIANPAYVTNSSGIANSTTILASLLYDVYGTYYDPAIYAHVPDGILATFSSDALGSVSPASSTTINGAATSIFTAGPNNGNSTVTVNINGQPATTTVYIISGPVFNTRTSLIYNNIQPAIDDVLTIDGDTLVVLNGTFLENVDVTKILTITALGVVVVNPLDTSIPIFSVGISGNGTIINGFNLTGAINSYGVALNGPTGCTISNNTIFSNLGGIYTLDASTNYFIANNITQNDVGLDMYGASEYNTIINNLFTQNGVGISILDGYGNLIATNNISQNTNYGVFLYGSTYQISGTQVTGNYIGSNNNGIYIFNGGGNTIDTNTITGNVIGIFSDTGGYDNIIYNSIENNGAGIQLYLSDWNWISNTFISNDYGIYQVGGTGNLIEGNYFEVTNPNGRGIYLENTNSNTIDYNSIVGGVYGIESIGDTQNSYLYNFITGSAYRGMFLTNPVMDIINGNSIDTTINGMLITGGSENNLTGNVILLTGSGIEIQNSNNNNITSNNLFSNTFALYLFNGSGNLIAGNIIGSNGSGIELHDSSNNIINGANALTNNTFGVYIANGSGNTVDGNLIQDTLYGGSGIQLESTISNTIINNLITNALMDFRYGIYANGGSGNSLTGNNASNNHAGIEMHTTSGNTIDGNVLTNNTMGIFMDTAASNLFYTNTINNNGAGVEMHSSHNNIFNNSNLITNNTFGIIAFGSNNNNITNSTFNNNGAAVNLQTCTNTKVTNNVMDNNTYGVYIQSGDHNQVQALQLTNTVAYGSGVYLDNTSQNIVNQNSFNNAVQTFTYGIYQTGGASNTLESNTATNNHAGIELHSTDNNIIQLNTLYTNTLGVFLQIGTGNNITSNNLTNNGAGIEIHQATGSNLLSNNLTNNVYGFYLDQLTSSNVKSNDLNTNTVGLFSDNSNSNEIYTNNFSSNTTQAYDTGTNNWDNGINTGNYWSDYSGKGVYPILGGLNIDHYPTNIPF